MTRAEAIEKLKSYDPMSMIPAIQMAIKALEGPQWIPTSERLPELYERVLVTDSEYVELSMLGRKYNEGYVWLFDTCWNDLEDLPYWMPLPEPWRGDAE